MGSSTPSLQPRLVVILVGLLVVVLLGYVYWPRHADHGPGPPNPVTPSNDPRVTFATPFRNVRSEVKYVGDKVCAGCHTDLAKTYAEHPMARSIASIATAAPIERYTADARNPFELPGVRYHLQRKSDRVWHMETLIDSQGNAIADNGQEVHFTVGSGHSGRAYLLQRDGYLLSSPLTWYPQKKVWDLSPGYDVKHNPHFDRPITPDCLFCHSNQADAIPDTLNHYRQTTFQSIGCERCHGPGELHVKKHSEAKFERGLDHTIVNPAHLDHELREAVCQQCHLLGKQRIWRRGRNTFDFRPGLPFSLIMTEFVAPTKETGSLAFVGSVEQMYASRCFTKSTGKSKMGCTSCHDPHTLPAEEKKVAFYRERCLNCHKERGCSLPLAARQEKQDNCLNCHMPKTGSTLNHTAITDHSIPRCAGRVERKEEATLDLVPFHRDRVDDPELGRDLGIALVKLADTQSGESARSLSEKAWPMLDAAVRRHSDDLAAWEALGSAMWFQGRLEDAFATFQTVLDRAPMRENTLFLMTTLSLRLRRVEAARGYADRLLKVNPHRWRYHFVLAQAQGQANQWRAALQAGEAARKLNPAEFGVRQLVVLCHLRLGEVEKAQQELETMLRLNAPQPEALRAWFEKERLR